VTARAILESRMGTQKRKVEIEACRYLSCVPLPTKRFEFKEHLRGFRLVGGPAVTKRVPAKLGRGNTPVQNPPLNGNNSDAGLLNVSEGLLSEIRVRTDISL